MNVVENDCLQEYSVLYKPVVLLKEPPQRSVILFSSYTVRRQAFGLAKMVRWTKHPDKLLPCSMQKDANSQSNGASSE